MHKLIRRALLAQGRSEEPRRLDEDAGESEEERGRSPKSDSKADFHLGRRRRDKQRGGS